MIRRRAVLVVGLILLGFSASARLYRLEADPPHQIVPGYTGHTHFRDEPAKAHEARNKAVFGKWKLNDADEYGFWRRQSPVCVYGQYLWFKLFGVSYASARLYVVMYGVAGIMLCSGSWRPGMECWQPRSPRFCSASISHTCSIRAWP